MEIAKVIHNHILPNIGFYGLYQLAVDPISKYDLLLLIKEIYGKDTKIVPTDSFIMDRSLKAEKFQKDFGIQSTRMETVNFRNEGIS